MVESPDTVVTGSRNVSRLKILGTCSHFGVTADAMPADELLEILPQQQLPIQLIRPASPLPTRARAGAVWARMTRGS